MNEPRPIAIEGSDARVDRAAPTGGEGDGTIDCGALIDWQKGDGGASGGIALVGLMWVVLGTILVHDRVLAEGEWEGDGRGRVLTDVQIDSRRSSGKD